jgi:hypothetical protein
MVEEKQIIKKQFGTKNKIPKKIHFFPKNLRYFIHLRYLMSSFVQDLKVQKIWIIKKAQLDYGNFMPKKNLGKKLSCGLWKNSGFPKTPKKS